ncbi:2'-5' RNA ligase family protein [Glycomyces arizonensis]|uniref:2'-5' RNA ligase family protein n=1 Tax=Glycomyces arizonensis TaxID=256035 RepID=UPI000421FB23|nr:2'-5' RNA ligase family protein [Glycomyces arizonensis]
MDRTGADHPGVTVGVAIPVPERWRIGLDAARIASGDPLGGIVPAHLTLLGPTVIDTEVLGPLEEHLEDLAANMRPFELHLRGTGSFRPVTEVVFVAVVDGIAVCEQLESAIRNGPIKRREQRFPYHPHVTVAQDVDKDALDRTFGALRDFEARFEVDSFTLYTHGTTDEAEATPWTPERVFRFLARLSARRNVSHVVLQ